MLTLLRAYKRMTPARGTMSRPAREPVMRDMPARAKVATGTIVRLERGEALKERTIDAIQAALEAAGVEFTNGDQPGVKLIKNAMGAEEISRQIDTLEDKISSMPAPTEPSPESGM